MNKTGLTVVLVSMVLCALLVSLDVKADLQSEIREKLGDVQIPSGIPTDLPTFRVYGNVGLVESSNAAGFVSGNDVIVTTKVDLNNDGSYFDLIEKRETHSDSSGNFSITGVPYLLANTFIIEFSKDGYQKVIKTVKGNTLTDIKYDVLMYPMQKVECGAENCTIQSGTAQLIGVPAKSGYIQNFDPTTQTQAFPGSFEDDKNNLLLSQTFADFRLDKGGVLEKEAVMRIMLPSTTWNILTDEVASNNQIDVPLYYFDETKAEWIRHSKLGWLENGQYDKIPEAELDSIRSGKYEGIVFGVGLIDHLSYWNVDWPISTQACIKITVYDKDKKPVVGARIETRGISYNGLSAPQTTDGKGEVTIGVMRSESSSEDIDRDGVNGEESKVEFSAYHSDSIFNSGAISITGQQGDCSSGSVSQNSTFNLDDSTMLKPEGLCEVHGKVIFNGQTLRIGPSTDASAIPSNGVIPQLKVQANSDGDLVKPLCDATGVSNCVLNAETNSDGRFKLVLPIYRNTTYGVSLGGMGAALGSNYYSGSYSFAVSCPVTSYENPIVIGVPFVAVASDPDMPSVRLVINEINANNWNVTISGNDSGGGVVGYKLASAEEFLTSYSDGWVAVEPQEEFSLTLDVPVPEYGKLFGLLKDKTGNVTLPVWVDAVNRDSSAMPNLASGCGCSIQDCSAREIMNMLAIALFFCGVVIGIVMFMRRKVI